jgi:hypothetical protein
VKVGRALMIGLLPLLFVGAPPARAGAKAPPPPPKEDSDPNDQPKLIIGPNVNYSHQYAPILGQDPATGQTQDYDPASCRGVQEVPCNVIPIDFLVPKGLKKADTYLAVFDLSWANATGVCGVPAAGCAEGDELDMYLWSNPEGTKNTTTSLEKDASGSEPKRFFLDVTTGQHFQLVIAHSQGTSNPGGYKLAITTQYVPFTAPQQSTDLPSSPPPANPTVGVPAAANATPPAASSSTAPAASGVTAATPPTTAADTSASPSADAGSLGLDPSLAGLNGGAADAALASAANIFRKAPEVKAPGPVSGGAAWLAYGLLPFVLAGGSWWLLRRRRPLSLRARDMERLATRQL